ncbi:MAG: hypothetical protein HOE90_00415 [Bacteriovoracaceae bacterium]|nr:hypothetical protein [Bacteriovoracaceae bacterium]
MQLEITSIYASVAIIIYVFLSLRVALLRGKEKVGIGSEGASSVMVKSIRIHGNFSEYAPLTIILLALLEQQALPSWFLHLFGALFIVSRVLHLYGLSQSKGRTFGRFYGTICNFSLLLFGSFIVLFKVIF